MKKLFIIANWKSYKTIDETRVWLDQMKSFSIPDQFETIICAPFICLSDMKQFIQANNLSMKIGVQNVSPFSTGPYTGEINAQQAHEVVTHAIVGHSERRRYFGETDEQVIKKIERLLEYAITPILCISDMKQMDYYLANGSIIAENFDKIIFVYEPPSAISGGGTYHAESPETASSNAGQISDKIGHKVITLYGGSVNPQNCSSFFTQEHIDGGLVGQASLTADTFQQLFKSL